jgi:outer membrane protein OmpA-like peptidoglycan-associated protein
MSKLIPAAAVGLLMVSGLGVWLIVSTFRELEAGLEAEKQRSASLSQELHERTRALQQSRFEANTARQQAELAFRDAEDQAAAAQDAEDQKSEAEQARIQSEQTAREAQNREKLARTELLELRKRRERELDRMQQALSKIAPTRRTASGMVVELANDSFYFDFDKSTLRPENREILSRIAGVLLASQGYRLFVYGHTDDIGAADYNQELSLRRATTVAGYLQEAGVPEELISIQGLGKSSPRVKNNSSRASEKPACGDRHR